MPQISYDELSVLEVLDHIGGYFVPRKEIVQALDSGPYDRFSLDPVLESLESKELVTKLEGGTYTDYSLTEEGKDLIHGDQEMRY